MTAATTQGILLAVWICFAVLALIAVIGVFVWAVRARQFSSQDRARHLPLRSDIPPEEPGPQREDATEEQEEKGNAPV